MQTEMHTAEPLVTELTSFEVKITTEKLKDINCQLLIKLQHNWSKQVVF
jgi:hypothetical protein